MNGEWMNDASRALARELWDEGLSATAIGRHVGCSKSSILGYAHRAGWPPRPSPIRRAPQSEPAPDKRRGAKPPPAPIAAPAPPPVVRTCQWTDSQRRPWVFCDQPVVRPGSAWCLEHHRRCYVRPPRWDRWAA